MKEMPLLQRMLKMGDIKRLQVELQYLCAREADYFKIVQSWQDEVSEIALQVNAKLVEFKAMQTTVASLLEEPATAELVNTARECVEQMDKDLAGLKADFTEFTKKIKEILKGHKEQKTASGSGTSHK